MKIIELLNNIKVLDKYCFNKDIQVNGISVDSRCVKNENIFVCTKGDKYDSHNDMEKLQKVIDVFIVDKINKKIPKCQILVENTHKILLKLLFNFNKIDKNKIKIIGVTGTNGKTSTSFYTYYLLKSLGKNVAVLGTNGCMINGDKYPSSLTTPDPKEFVALFKKMIERNVSYLIMEVSAHAVKCNRVRGIDFEIGAFTNLTQDHLDDFYNLDNYAFYKLQFLKQCKKQIINIDDKYGKMFEKECSNSFSLSFTKCEECRYMCKIHKNFLSIYFCNKEFNFKTNLIADFSLKNMSMALIICNELGFNLAQNKNMLLNVPDVEGRYNIFQFGNKTICIDYAHSPDAIEQVLKNLKEISNDIIVVFGASGFRDCKKRKKMGLIASKYASYIILTADNPRYENVNDICYQISEGIKKVDYVVIKNREEAIKYAFSIAKDNSVIAILGKGNEESQDICSVDIPYSDIDMVNSLIKQKKV